MGLANYKNALAVWVLLVFTGVGCIAQVVRVGGRSPRSVAAARASDNSMTFTLSAGAVNFTLVAGKSSNPGAGSININTSWSCTGINPTLQLYAYFNSPIAALTDGAGHSIPSSAILISSNGGGLRRVNGNSPFGAPNAGLRLAAIPAIGGRGGSRTDVLNFDIDLSGAALSKLPPGTYTGTLIIQGQAQ